MPSFSPHNIPLKPVYRKNCSPRDSGSREQGVEGLSFKITSVSCRHFPKHKPHLVPTPTIPLGIANTKQTLPDTYTYPSA